MSVSHVSSSAAHSHAPVTPKATQNAGRTEPAAPKPKETATGKDAAPQVKTASKVDIKA